MTHVLPAASTGSQLIDTLRGNIKPNSKVCDFTHTALYDEGCKEFFSWLISGDEPNGLESPEERIPRSFTSLTLSDVRMSDDGFKALILWLESLKSLYEAGHHSHLTSLSLRFNVIIGDAEIAQSFVSALTFSTESSLSSSTLSYLSFGNNPLSSSFKTTLFSLLPSLPSLRTLELTMTHLNKDDALALASYIENQTMPCKLTELKASANEMGYGGVRAIIKAIQRCWTLERVELYSNEAADTQIDILEENEDIDGDEDNRYGEASAQQAMMGFAISSGCGWWRLQLKLKRVLGRNIFLKKNTVREALSLLRYSRLVLLQKATSPLDAPITACDDCDCVAPVQQKLAGLGLKSPSPNFFRFTHLPTEIRLHILSALAPTLSTAQRLRIFDYAVDPSTLPSLRLCFPTSSSGCVPDPGNLAFDAATSGLSKRVGKKVGSLTNVRDVKSCSGRACMAGQTVVCQKQTMREKWLALVKCDAFDP